MKKILLAIAILATTVCSFGMQSGNNMSPEELKFNKPLLRALTILKNTKDPGEYWNDTQWIQDNINHIKFNLPSHDLKIWLEIWADTGKMDVVTCNNPPGAFRPHPYRYKSTHKLIDQILAKIIQLHPELKKYFKYELAQPGLKNELAKLAKKEEKLVKKKKAIKQTKKDLNERTDYLLEKYKKFEVKLPNKTVEVPKIFLQMKQQ